MYTWQNTHTIIVVLMLACVILWLNILTGYVRNWVQHLTLKTVTEAYLDVWCFFYWQFSLVCVRRAIDCIVLLLKCLHRIQCCSFVRSSKAINSRVLNEVLVRVQLVGIIDLLVTVEDYWVWVLLFFVKWFVELITRMKFIQILCQKTVYIMTVQADWNLNLRTVLNLHLSKLLELLRWQIQGPIFIEYVTPLNTDHLLIHFR